MTTIHCAFFAEFSEILDFEPVHHSITPDNTSSEESATLSQIQKAKEYIASLPQVDLPKIEMLKEKLCKEELAIISDPGQRLEQAQRIAEKMLKLEQDLFGK